MTIPVTKGKGVTVIAVETDRTSMWPPLCQVLMVLCCSFRDCSLSKMAEFPRQSKTVSALGVIQLMVGLFNIGLGPGRTTLHPEDFAHLGAAYWLGGVFMLSGIVSLLANRFPSMLSGGFFLLVERKMQVWAADPYCPDAISPGCPLSPAVTTLFLVGFVVLLNIIGFIFTVVGIRMYSMDIADINYMGFCNRDRTPNEDDNCQYVADLFRRLLTGMDNTMIVLTAVTLFVCVTLTVLAIRALFFLGEKEEARDEEMNQPEKEALLTSPDSNNTLSLSGRTHRPMPYNTTAALGTSQIMVGVFTIGLGTGRSHLHPGDFHSWGVSYWLGGAFILAGVLSLFADLLNNRFLVGITVAVNVIGSVLSVIGFALYGADMGDYLLLGFCRNTPDPFDDCKLVQSLLQRLVAGMDVAMIVLTAVQLVVCSVIAALGIRDLLDLEKKEEARHDEMNQPEKEAPLTSPGA